ncbi:hypothetical protein DIZ27_31650 [Streptomyces sp. NWU339]|nr:hypothetical protein DIZ27_31650 [Streptomyces sp. NWU339]
MPFTATIQADGGEPVVLTTKEPALLKGTLTNYLPRGDLHVLEKPVDLVAPDAPHRVLARIPKFPVKMGAP